MWKYGVEHGVVWLAHLSVVDHGHEEGLDEVIEVLGQHELVVPVLEAARVQQPALHAAAEGADAVALQLRLKEAGRGGGRISETL